MEDNIPVNFDELDRLMCERKRYIVQKDDAAKRQFQLELDLDKTKNELKNATKNVTETENKIKRLAQLLGEI